MKKTLIIFALSLGFWACSKTEVQPTPAATTTTNTQTTPPVTTTFSTIGQKLIAQGTFQNGVHAVSGMVKVYESTEGKRNLVFENFNTTAGPDLRIWVAETTQGLNYIEITDKVLDSGNFYFPISSTLDITKSNQVLIWCKSFAVLFGSAKLQ